MPCTRFPQQECGRFDLLNKLYRDQGKWDQAIKSARDKDRANLRTTYYLQAKDLEMQGRIDDAIAAYERAEANAVEVPRLLIDDPVKLEEYVNRTNDKVGVGVRGRGGGGL